MPAWVNHHENVTVNVSQIITVENTNPDQPNMTGMRDTALRIQQLIRDALAANVRIRACGSRWSFSDIPVVPNGWIVETHKLNWRFAVSSGDILPTAGVTAEELFLVQCGTKIARINESLETPNQIRPSTSTGRRRALRTSGASNGQTIAGALGTGVHGSAIDVGGMESQIVGIQILTANQNLWIERASQPITVDSLATRLGATLVRDDLMFEAAIVSLGALGIVHAVMLKSTGRYLLNSSMNHIRFGRIKGALNTLDFRGSGIPDESRRPYFLQAIIDPDDLKDKGDRAKVFATVRYKEVCPPNFKPKYDLAQEHDRGTDVPKLIAKFIKWLPDWRDATVSILMEVFLREQADDDDEWKTPGQVYTFTEARRGVASSGFGVPINQTTRALDIMAQAFRDHDDAPVVLTCRYVQKSPGILSFTRFDPTCVIDIDGIDSAATQDLIRTVADRFDSAGMPYTQHWGKTNSLSAARVDRAYGGNVDRWNQARRLILPDATERDAFSNDFLDAVGLNG